MGISEKLMGFRASIINQVKELPYLECVLKGRIPIPENVLDEALRHYLGEQDDFELGSLKCVPQKI